MVRSKIKKQHSHKIFHRKSLLSHSNPKRRLVQRLRTVEQKLYRRILRVQHFAHNLYQSYRSICLLIALFFRIFIFIDQFIRELYAFIERIIQIIRVIYGWIQMIRAIFSAIHLIVSRTMMLSHRIYHIFYLLSILFQPFSNRKFEKAVRSFSNFVCYYYSSNGACYTLKARTSHIVRSVRARWRSKRYFINNDQDGDDDNDIYYDAFSEEFIYL